MSLFFFLLDSRRVVNKFLQHCLSDTVNASRASGSNDQFRLSINVILAFTVSERVVKIPYCFDAFLFFFF